jgi:hypothetical protein
MNVLVVLVVASMSMAGLPPVADRSAAPVVNEPLLRVADNDDFAARKDAYLQKTRDEMDEWRNKMHAAGEQAEAKGHEASADTKAHLDRTWTTTERSWRKLQTESAEGWDNTKRAYERSTADLHVQWYRLHPEDQD